MMTILAQLVAKSKDIDNYETYVFKLLDEDSITKMNQSYVMCVRYPNWEAEEVNIGQVGYVKVHEVRAGIDQWFDGQQMNYYKYSDIIFYKFISKPQDQTNELFL